MGLTLIEWVAAIITILCPIWATILWYIPIKTKWMYPISAIGIYIPTVLLTFNPIKIKGVTQWLHWYGLFFIVYIAAFGAKLKWTDWNQAAAISIFALFIGGEYWEIPIFIYDVLAKLGILHNSFSDGYMDAGWLFTHVRRLYTLAACYLLATLANVKMTRIGWIFIGAGTAFCFLLLLPIGLGIRVGFLYLREMARITALSFTGIIILEGYRIGED